MTKTIRHKLINFSNLTDEGSREFVSSSRGRFIADFNRINLDEWLEKQKTSGNYVEGQRLVENVRRYKNLERG